VSLPQLFTGRPLPSYLEEAGGRILRAADKLAPLAWWPNGRDGDRATDEDVAAAFLPDVAIVVPQVDWTKLRYEPEETTVTVREPGSPTLERVRGVRLTAVVPYVGDWALLTCRPTEHGTGASGHSEHVWPQGAEHGRLGFVFEGRHLHIEDVERALGDAGVRIVDHLNYARADIDRFRDEFIPRLLDVIARRRAFHDELDDLERRLS